jgi:hypothetical protein
VRWGLTAASAARLRALEGRAELAAGRPLPPAPRQPPAFPAPASPAHVPLASKAPRHARQREPLQRAHAWRLRQTPEEQTEVTAPLPPHLTLPAPQAAAVVSVAVVAGVVMPGCQAPVTLSPIFPSVDRVAVEVRAGIRASVQVAALAPEA